MNICSHLKYVLFVLIIYSNYGHARSCDSPGPEPYKEEKIQKAIDKYLGAGRTIIQGGILLKAPQYAAVLARVQMHIKTTIPLQKILVLCDANDNSFVALLTIPEELGIEDVDYWLRAKMQNPGYIVVIGEGRDGNLYLVKNLVN